MKTYFNYIDGKWKTSISNETYPSINPANTEEILGFFQKSQPEDVKNAVKAAKKAFPGWSNTPAPIRGDILFNLINLLENHKEELAHLITKEVGKSLREASGEVRKAIQAMKQFSGEATRLKGETIPSYDSNIFAYTVREPLGVVGVIAPYNFPLGIGIWKIAPALIAGNTVVFKPASNTSMVGIKIIELFEEAGVPPGVLNMITGKGSVIGKEFGLNTDFKAVSFTGSSDVGIQLGKDVTSRGGKVQAEMGGKNPAIVLEDANIDTVVSSVVTSGFLDNGQRCTGTSRLIVLRSVAQKVINKLVEKANELVIGDGLDPKTDNGPIIDENQLNLYLYHVKTALEEGAVLEYGGKRLLSKGMEKGYFVAPTVFSNVNPAMTISTKEIFGPVIAILEVETFEEAMEVANNIEFGLSSTIYTNDLNKAFEFVRNTEAGVTHVNLPSTYFENQFPFGGKKTSSIGPREQGSTALDFWTDYKTVYINP